MSRSVRRVAAVLLAGILPWAVVTWNDGYYLVFSIGETNHGVTGFYSIVEFFSTPRVVPAYFDAWPRATLLYVLTLVAVVLSLRTRLDDRRVTAGLLVLAGLQVLQFALGLNHQRTIFTVPLGTLSLWGAAVYEYWTHRVPARQADSQ